MASLTGNLVAETYKALLKTIDNDILTASEKQITDGFGGGSNVFIDSNGFLRANKYKVTNGLATQFLKADGSLDANTYLTSITSSQIITALGYTPVTNARTLTINGTTYDLSANRSWTVGGTAAVWGNITGTLSNQTDLQTALNAKFNNPTGTISQYIRGDGSLATFPTLPGGLPTGGTAGQILAKIDTTDYNAHWIDNFATQTKNEVKLGQTLAKGAAVYVSSANGTNMIVSAASNTSEALSSKTFGLLETGGATNALVKCVTFGLLAGLDTSTAQAGDPVWLGVNGALIFGLANKPYAPAHLVYIGVVTRVQQNNGEIFVNVQNGFELKEIHDVYIADPANNHGLFYDLADGLWKNKSIASALGYTPQAQLNGTGFVKASGTSITYDNSTYLTTTDAASTYQRLDKLASSLFASATNYPNNNAVIAGLALKADAANPIFTGSMNIVGLESRINFYDENSLRKYFIGYSSGQLSIYQDAGSATRFYINSSGQTFIPGTLTVGSIIKDGGTATQFLKADGSIDLSTYVTSTALADYLLITTAASTYQRLDRIASSLFASATNYPNNNAVIAGLALKADAANPVFTGSMNIQGLESRINFYDENNLRKFFIGYSSGQLSIFQDAGSATRFQINSSGNITTGVNNTITSWGFIKSGGTSSQFLMADGSVSTLSGLVTGSGTTNYLPKWTSGSALGNSIISDNGTIVSVAGNLQSSRFYNTFVNAGNNSRNSFQSFNLNEASLTPGWIAADFGDLGTTSNRVVFGSGYGGKAIIGGHSGLLDAWASLLINPGGGNVIIGGTTDAGFKFDVNGTGRFSSQLYLGNFNGESLKFQSSTSTGSTYQRFYNSAGTARGYLGLFWSGSADYMVYDSGSLQMNINSSNSFTFTGGGAATFSSSVTAGGTISTTVGYGILSGGGGFAIGPSSTRGIIALNGSSDQILTFSTQSYIYNSSSLFRMLSSSDIDFVVGGSQRMIIKSDTGNVGIGTTAATELLEIKNANPIFSINQTTQSNDSGIRFKTNDTLIGTITAQGGVGNMNINMGVTPGWGGFIVLKTDTVERMRITSGGNVLIGTTTDAGIKLLVNGNFAINTGSFYGFLGSIQASYAGSTAYPTIYGSAADRWVMHINPHISYTQNGSNGFTGSMTGATIRMASDSAATNYWDIGIGVCSVGADKFAIGRNASALFTITNNGNVTATAFFESSDIRLKTLIDGFAQIAGIENLKAKLYEKNGKLELGYFAQDAEKLMPYAVTKGTDGFLSLSYREVHTAKIARLEEEVAELKAKLNAA